MVSGAVANVLQFGSFMFYQNNDEYHNQTITIFNEILDVMKNNQNFCNNKQVFVYKTGVRGVLHYKDKGLTYIFWEFLFIPILKQKLSNLGKALL